jgi:hypothetical protein
MCVNIDPRHVLTYALSGNPLQIVRLPHVGPRPSNFLIQKPPLAFVASSLAFAFSTIAARTLPGSYEASAADRAPISRRPETRDRATGVRAVNMSHIAPIMKTQLDCSR